MLKLFENWRSHLEKESVEVDEKIRSGSKKTFKWNEFKRLKGPHAMIQYCEASGLKEMGCGSSRCVYVLTSKTALKIASGEGSHEGSGMIDAGIAQNKTEIKTSATEGVSDILAKVLSYDKERHLWIVSELVRPVNEGDIRRAFGIPWYKLIDSVKDAAKGPMRNLPLYVRDLKKEYAEDFSTFKEDEVYDFLDAINNLVTHTDLLSYDIAAFAHWGKTPDDRIVLLDYGLDQQVNDDFYGLEEDKTPRDFNVLFEHWRKFAETFVKETDSSLPPGFDGFNEPEPPGGNPALEKLLSLDRDDKFTIGKKNIVFRVIGAPGKYKGAMTKPVVVDGTAERSMYMLKVFDKKTFDVAIYKTINAAGDTSSKPKFKPGKLNTHG